MNPPYPHPSSIILSNTTRGIFTADFTRSLTKCVRRAFEYACNTETLVVPPGGGGGKNKFRNEGTSGAGDLYRPMRNKDAPLYFREKTLARPTRRFM